MSNLTIVRPDFESFAVEGTPVQNRLIQGNPCFKTWECASSDDGLVRTGFWETTPGAYLSVKGGTWELCHILSGVSELTEDGGAPIQFRAGDVFVMKPAFKGIWRCVETTRKLWVTYR